MKNKAFTLIELLVVIAIIALLMAIIVPLMRRAREQTYHVLCRSNLRQVGISQFSYAHDHKGRITPGDGMDENGPSHIWDMRIQGVGGVCNLGHLLDGGYLPMPPLRAGTDNIRNSALWCPALLRGYGRESWGLFRLWTNEEVPEYAPFEQRNLSGWGQPNRIVVCSYEFRVRMDNPDIGQYALSENSPRAREGKGIPLEKIGMSSIASDIWSWSFGRLVHNDTYNILVGDGSVHVFKDDGVLRCEEFVPAIWPQGLRSDLIFAVFDRELGLRQPVGVPLPIDFDEFYSNPWSY